MAGFVRRSPLGSVSSFLPKGGATQRGTFRVIGVPEAIAKLKLVGTVAGRSTGLIVKNSAYDIRNRAREIVHSDTNPWGGRKDDSYEYTGNLRDGIEVSGRTGGLGSYTQEVTASSRAGGSEREYAAYEELGTHRTPAHPYLRPAMSQQVPLTVGMLKALAATLERL